MTDTLHEKAKRHPQLVNRALVFGMIASLSFAIGVTVFFSSGQTDTMQRATQLAQMQATLDYENATLRSQRLVTHAREQVEAGEINRALFLALEAVNMPQPPPEAQRLLSDLLQMPAIERLIPQEYQWSAFGFDEPILSIFDYEEEKIGYLDITTGEVQEWRDLPKDVSDFMGLNADWGIVWLPDWKCSLVKLDNWTYPIKLPTCPAAWNEMTYVFSQDDRYLAIAANWNYSPWLYDLQTGESRELLDVGVRSPYMGIDSQYVYIVSDIIYDWSTDTITPGRYSVRVGINTVDLPEPFPLDAFIFTIAADGNLYAANDGLIISPYASGYVNKITGTSFGANSDFEASPDSNILIATEGIRNGRGDASIFLQLIRGKYNYYKNIPNLYLPRLGNGNIFFTENSYQAILTDVADPFQTTDNSHGASYFAIMALYPEEKPYNWIPGNFQLISLTDSYLLALDMDDNALVRLNAPDWSETWRYPIDLPLIEVKTVTQAGRVGLIIPKGDSSQVLIIDVEKGDLLHQWQMPFMLSYNSHIALAPASAYLAVVSQTGDFKNQNTELYIYDSASGTKTYTTQLPFREAKPVYSQSGETLVVAGFDSDYRDYALVLKSSGELLREINIGDNFAARGTIWLNDNELNVASGEVLQRFNLVSGDILQEVKRVSAYAREIVVAPDYQTVIEVSNYDADGFHALTASFVRILTGDTLYELQSWGIPNELKDSGKIHYSGNYAAMTPTIDDKKGIVIWKVESIAEMADRARQTRYIQPWCDASVAYLNLSACTQASDTTP